MNVQTIILTAVLLVYSCNSPTKAVIDQNMALQKQDFSIISATQTQWSGGREGVKGSHYKIRLKNEQGNSFLFKSLVINTVRTAVVTKTEGKFVELTASVTDPRNEPLFDVSTGQEVPAKTSSVKASKYWLEYTIGGSKIIKKLIIPKFTVSENQEFYP